jgi:hypothetical protein
MCANGVQTKGDVHAGPLEWGWNQQRTAGKKNYQHSAGNRQRFAGNIAGLVAGFMRGKKGKHQEML